MEAPRQLTLFARANRERFEEWLRHNPQCWHLFVQFTLLVIAAGHERYSADAICHRIRWHVDIETKDPDGFKINNNHAAFLARRFSEKYPEYANFFEKRRSPKPKARPS